MKDIDLLMKAADEIAKEINKRYPRGGGGMIVKGGQNDDPTKEIDMVAENTVLEWLKENHLNWNLISEESGWKDRGGDLTLLLDPIDGTYNAIYGIPFYSTSLALVRNADPRTILSGVVANIMTGSRFWAERGGGAYMDGEAIGTREYCPHEAVFSSFLGQDAVEENHKLFSLPRRARYFGCISLEMCFVAKGSLDLFALFYRTPRITDIAAAHLILTEAGGENMKIDHSNNLSRYEPGDEEEIKGVISLGDGRALKAIKECLGVGI
ncbi:MAG: inositol monophosphatase family protein [Thermoplasmatota archaeon]